MEHQCKKWDPYLRTWVQVPKKGWPTQEAAECWYAWFEYENKRLPSCPPNFYECEECNQFHMGRYPSEKNRAIREIRERRKWAVEERRLHSLQTQLYWYLYRYANGLPFRLQKRRKFVAKAQEQGIEP